jgi:hypothetical protein
MVSSLLKKWFTFQRVLSAVFIDIDLLHKWSSLSIQHMKTDSDEKVVILSTIYWRLTLRSRWRQCNGVRKKWPAKPHQKSTVRTVRNLLVISFYFCRCGKFQYNHFFLQEIGKKLQTVNFANKIFENCLPYYNIFVMCNISVHNNNTR